MIILVFLFCACAFRESWTWGEAKDIITYTTVLLSTDKLLVLMIICSHHSIPFPCCGKKPLPSHFEGFRFGLEVQEASTVGGSLPSLPAQLNWYWWLNFCWWYLEAPSPPLPPPPHPDPTYRETAHENPRRVSGFKLERHSKRCDVWESRDRPSSESLPSCFFRAQYRYSHSHRDTDNRQQTQIQIQRWAQCRVVCTM